MDVGGQNETHVPTQDRYISIQSSVMHSLMRMNRKHPLISRLCTNISLITCFAVCLCASSYMFHLVDDILDDSFDDTSKIIKDSAGSLSNHMVNRPDVVDLKAILEQRGIPVDTLLERKDFNAAIESTGSITTEELNIVKSRRKRMSELNISISPDAHVFRNLIMNEDSTGGNLIDPSNPHSIVFDSESEFIERVEDNKDSVWLLGVVSTNLRLNEQNSHKNPRSILTDEIWATLVHRYISFGFKLGLLNCQKLHGICIDRGFIAADLILALPRGGDRMKDLVQFRPYSKQSNSNKLSSKQITNNIHLWVVSVLSERLRSLQTVDNILPVSLSFIIGTNQVRHLVRHWSWLSKKTQPINVLWLPQDLTSNEILLRKSSLILSALSVPYTGRVRFWVVHPSLLLQNKSSEKSDLNENTKLALSDPTVNTIPDLLDYLKCPPGLRFLILTPEAKCYSFGNHQGEFFNYNVLELCLRFLFPSANDFFCISFLILNLFLLFNSTFLIAQTILIIIYNSNQSLILQSDMNRSTRFGLARTVIRMVRQGWTSHVPNFWTNSFQSFGENPYSYLTTDPFLSTPNRLQIPNSNSISKFSLVCSKLIFCFKTLSIDFLSANLLLLLMILPLINLLSLNLATPFINLFLWFMRSMTMTKPIIAIRLAISSGHITLIRLLSVTFVLWFCLIISSMYMYSIIYGTDKMLTHHTYNRRSRRHRLSPSVILQRLNQSSPDQFWNELASFLLMSDRENKSDVTGTTTASSTTESDAAVAATTTIPDTTITTTTTTGTTTSNASSNKLSWTNSCPSITMDNFQSANPELVEGSRLLRRLCRLHRVLCRQTDQLACVSPPPPPPPLPPSSLISSLSPFNRSEHYQRSDHTGNPNSQTTAAHMYTWQCSFPSKYTSTSKPLRQKNSTEENRIGSIHLNQSKPSLKLPSTNDLCYEAEDERDASSDDDMTLENPLAVRSRTRTHIPTTVIRSGKNIHNSVDLSSDEDVCSSDQESSHDENDSSGVGLCTLDKSLDWPTWVVPCDACVVCWRKFRSGVRLSALPCGHGFHEVCIRRWLDTGALDCPVCRWPAYAPHLRQQCQMIGQLIEAVQAALNPIRNTASPNTNHMLPNQQSLH